MTDAVREEMMHYCKCFGADNVFFNAMWILIGPKADLVSEHLYAAEVEDDFAY